MLRVQQREVFAVIHPGPLHEPRAKSCELHTFYLDLHGSEEIQNGRQSTARNI